jgi:hypothetical protein
MPSETLVSFRVNKMDRLLQTQQKYERSLYTSQRFSINDIRLLERDPLESSNCGVERHNSKSTALKSYFGFFTEFFFFALAYKLIVYAIWNVHYGPQDWRGDIAVVGVLLSFIVVLYSLVFSIRCFRFGFSVGFTLSNALAIFDATECAVCSSFLSAMSEAPQKEIAIAPALVPGFRWPEVAAEYGASASCSAACYEQVEYIGVLPVIVTERKLGEIQRQILLRDVMEAAHYAAFEQCPERFDVVRVNYPANILALTVTYRFVGQAGLFQEPIARMFVRCDQLYLVANCLADESIQRRSIRVLDDLANHVSFPADSSDDSHLAGNFSASTGHALIAMAVAVLPANKGFVYFNNTHEFFELFIVHCSTNPCAHIPRGFVARLVVKNGALDLKRTHTLLRVQHQEADCKPSLERILGILEYRARDQREPIAFLRALVTLPMPSARQFVDLLTIATRALDLAVRPAVLEEEQFAGFFVWEKLVQIPQLDHV